MKKKFTHFLLLGLFLIGGSGLVAQNVFQGTAATLSTPANWSLGLPDGTTAALENITFNGSSNAAGNTLDNDLLATTRNRISFLSGVTTKTINGSTANTFQAFGADAAIISNNSGVTHTIGFPIVLNSDLEINTIGGINNALIFSGDISASGGTRTITINAQGNVTFTGNISDGTGKINIIKNGTGNLTFTGVKTFTGTVRVNGSIFTLNESISAERIEMGTGTTFSCTKTGQATYKNLIMETGSTYRLTTATTDARITDTLKLATTTNTGSNSASQFTYGPTATLVYAFPTGTQLVRSQEWKVGTFDILANRPHNVIIDNAPSGVLTLPGTFPPNNLNRAVDNDMIVRNGATISLGVNQLDVLGDLTCEGTGAFIGSQRANITLNGTTINTLRMKPRNINIPAQLYNNYLRLLVLRDNAKLTLLDTLVISASTTAGGDNRGSLQLIGEGTQVDATNELLVIESNSDGNNGQITTVFSTLPVPIIGNIVLERYIPLSNSNLNGRAWRFISVPFLGTRPLGKNLAGEDWPFNRVSAKDGSNVAIPAQIAGKGTLVTGRNIRVATANAWGFDSWTQLSNISNSSIRKFEEQNTGDGGGNFSGASTVNNFTSLATNPLSATMDNAEPGYMLFVRGDRTTTEPGAGPTNLRFVGQRRNVGFSGTFPISGGATAENVVFGNPFACDFDVQALVAANSDKILNTFWFWDANINEYGGWRFINQVSQDNWTVDGVDFTQSAYTIKAGQAILLIPITGDPSVLAYDENMKATAVPSSGVNPFETGSGSIQLLGVKYYKERQDGVNVLLNGASVMLDSKYTNGYDDRKDINMLNPLGSSYNLSIVNDGKYLALDGRNNLNAGDKVSFWTSGLNVGKFSLEFLPKGLQSLGLDAYIVDKFLTTETKLNLADSAINYEFMVTSDAASSSPTRFEVIFKEASILPVNFTGITAEEMQGNVNVKWNTATERGVRHYEIQHSVNGRDFGKAGIVNARNLGAANYSFLHQQPGSGDHFYRILSEDVDGTATLSQVVKVNIGNGKPAFTVFPTLIRENRVTLQFTGLTKGRYTLQLSDMSGKVLLSQKVDHNGGSASQSLVLPASISKGSYNLKLSGDNVNFVERIMKQ